MYVPMMKARLAELKAAEIVCDLFSDNIIPLIEILKEEGETVHTKENGKRVKIKIPPTQDSLITLDKINDILHSKNVFVDYFRFQAESYKDKVDIKQVQLSWQLSNDEDKYLQYVEKICCFNNMIPVISIKKGFDIKKQKLKDFIQNLHRKTTAIAFRITEEFLDEYSDLIETCMNGDDYLLFDIGNQNPESKIMELLELSSLNCTCKKILLNAPRKYEQSNSEFGKNGITNLIYTSARIQSEEYGLDGFGDYCGLKDALPKPGGGSKGAALALFYDFYLNKFYVYLEKNTDLGFGGYKNLIPLIINDADKLDKDRDCLAMAEVIKLDTKKSTGNWQTWHKINVIRSIHQMYKYYNNNPIE